MENASKALIIAGSVLIAVIILSLLVVFFSNLRSLQEEQSKIKQAQQATDYNKQYDVYNRNLYGSELLSLAHKIEDYKTREVEYDGYSEIILEVEISDNSIQETLNAALGNARSGRTSYNSEDLTLAIKGNKGNIPGIEKLTKDVGDISIEFKKGSVNVRRKISQLASMRSKDIEELGTAQSEYNSLIIQYNTYKSFLTELKSKVFKCVSFEHDDNTGRVKYLKYSL